MMAVEKTTCGREYKVKDLSLADLGRREIDLALVGMGGLMAYRDEFGPYKPHKGNRITVSSPVTARHAVLIETLTDLGGEVRWCPSDLSSTEDHAAAAVAYDSASVFAWKGQTLEERWWCTERALGFGDGRAPHLIVDVGGKVTLLIDEGVKAEKIYAKTGQLPDPSSTDNAELQIVLGIIRDGLKNKPMKFQSMTEALVGVSIEAASGVKTPYLQMQATGTLFPVINVNDSVTKSKFYNLSVCRNAFPGKKVVVCDYDHAGEGCAIALKHAGADVVVSEVDTTLATQALLRGFLVKPLEAVVSHADMFVANINNSSIFKVDNIKNMKDSANIYVITGPMLDRNRNTHTSIMQNIFRHMNHVVVVHPQTEEWFFPDIDSKITLLDNTSSGCPNFEASWSLTSHVVAALELQSKRGTGKYKNKVYDLAEHLEEKMVALHLGKHAATGSVMMKVMKIKKETKEEANEAMNMRSMLYKGAQACSLVGLIAFGLSTASKVKMDLSFSAIWE